MLLTYTGVLTAALPGLNHPQALTVNLAGSAVSNVVPFGGAVGVGATYAMTLSWGFDVPAVTLSILVTGIWNVFMKLGLPIVALLILIVAGQATATLVAPALIALAVLIAGIVVSDPDPSQRAARGPHRRAGPACGHACVRSSCASPRRRRGVNPCSTSGTRASTCSATRWKQLTVWMIVYNAGQFLLLLLCVRVLGTDTHELGWIEVLAAFSFANVLTTIAITPSGVGFVEAGAVAALIAFGGPEAASAAAVFLFRGFTYLMEIPLGAVGWAVWGMRRSWRRARARAPMRSRPDRSPTSTGRSVDEGLPHQLAQLRANRVSARRQQLGEEQGRDLFDGVDPEDGAGGATPSVFTPGRQHLVLRRVVDH